MIQDWQNLKKNYLHCRLPFLLTTNQADWVQLKQSKSWWWTRITQLKYYTDYTINYNLKCPTGQINLITFHLLLISFFLLFFSFYVLIRMLSRIQSFLAGVCFCHDCGISRLCKLINILIQDLIYIDAKIKKINKNFK